MPRGGAGGEREGGDEPQGGSNISAGVGEVLQEGGEVLRPPRVMCTSDLVSNSEGEL